MEKVQQNLKAPSRFMFEEASEHVYVLLLTNDCYPRFIRSENYKNLLTNVVHPAEKKKLFGLCTMSKKKPSTTVTLPSQVRMNSIGFFKM